MKDVKDQRKCLQINEANYSTSVLNQKWTHGMNYRTIPYHVTKKNNNKHGQIKSLDHN